VIRTQSALRGIIAALVVLTGALPACSPAAPSPTPSLTAAPATVPSLETWVAGWKPNLDTYVQARNAFADLVGRLSTTYADTARAAQDLAGNAASLHDAMVAVAPPAGLESAVQTALAAMDDVLAALAQVSEKCAAGASGCSASVDQWRTADAALTAALDRFTSGSP
jgi:hypothetical protein